jgi:hypothetical protein
MESGLLDWCLPLTLDRPKTNQFCIVENILGASRSQIKKTYRSAKTVREQKC